MLLALNARQPLALTLNPLLHPSTGPRSVGAIEQELQRLPHLTGDSRHNRREHKARLLDARAVKTAAEALGGKLPEIGESVHLILSGRFALAEFIGTALAIGGCKIDRLHIATLGFSRRNVETFAELIDGGQIGSMRLLFSHYFRGTSAALCELAETEFAKRPDQMELLSVRTHCKILLFKLADGRTVSLESSANARSCKNLENCTAFSDPGLYEFHRQWIDSLFTAARG